MVNGMTKQELERRVTELETVLEPFAAWANAYRASQPHDKAWPVVIYQAGNRARSLTYSQLMAAAEALRRESAK